MPGCEDIVCENIVLNIPPGKFRTWTNSLLIVSTMLSYALLLVPAREYIEDFAFQYVSLKHKQWSSNFIRFCMVLVTAVVATEAPYFADVLGTVGGLTDSYLAYILPSLVAVVARQTGRMDEKNNSYVTYLFYVILFGGTMLAICTLFGLVSSART